MGAMSFPSPPAPAFPPEHTSVTEETLRYDDVAQDGRLIPIAIPPTLDGLWRTVIVDHPGSRASIAKGILPILTRLTITSNEQSIRVDQPLEARSGFQLARSEENGQIKRLFMLLWCDVLGSAGRIGGMSGRPPGPRIPAGSMFAEHTFTRPFAPPGQRAVTELPGDGYPKLPEATYAQTAPATAADAPDGARWLGELWADPVQTAFSLDHTDSNQHVNSLVYIRVFLDSVWRRLATTSHGTKLRSRAIDIAYRKPCFAGDRVQPQLRLFEGADGMGAAGQIVDERGTPRCYVRVLFGP